MDHVEKLGMSVPGVNFSGPEKKKVEP
jgi:hypothetical protein